MTSLADDTDFIRALARHTGLTPSAMAKKAGVAATTINRPYNGTATSRISTPTLEKLRRAFPDFDWAHPEPDQVEEAPFDEAVQVELLPTFAGMGGGGTGDGERSVVSFSRALIEGELRASAEHLLAVEAEGNSMEPDFRGGDQILIDTRRRSLAAPGAFCLWDSDGYVIKYLERVQGSDPPRVRIVSARPELYPPVERLLEECDIRGRVVWFGRRVQ